MAIIRMSHAFAALALSILFAPPVFADPDKDESGHGRGRGRGGDYEYKEERGRHGAKHKEEYWDGNCKVERKWSGHEYKEERKCRGGDGHRPVYVQPQPVYVQPAPVYVQPPPTPAPATAQAPVVYPPWVVIEHGAPVYRSGYEPDSPAQRGVSYCNSDVVGSVLGGIAGGVLGNRVGKGSGRAAATIGGAVVGVLIGGEIGRRIDANDHACFAQALEFAPVGQRVEWPNAGAPNYVVVPGKIERHSGQYCRHYEAQVLTDGRWQRTNGYACRQPDGVWVSAR